MDSKYLSINPPLLHFIRKVQFMEPRPTVRKAINPGVDFFLKKIKMSFVIAECIYIKHTNIIHVHMRPPKIFGYLDINPFV